MDLGPLAWEATRTDLGLSVRLSSGVPALLVDAGLDLLHLASGLPSQWPASCSAGSERSHTSPHNCARSDLRDGSLLPLPLSPSGPASLDPDGYSSQTMALDGYMVQTCYLNGHYRRPVQPKPYERALLSFN